MGSEWQILWSDSEQTTGIQTQNNQFRAIDRLFPLFFYNLKLVDPSPEG